MSRQVAVVGILGGLGPRAHITFEQRLLAASSRRGAVRDGDHPVWILVSATDVPDRTRSLTRHRPDCVRALLGHARRLEAAGANFLVVTCNTAHAYHGEVQSCLALPWINLVERTVEALLEAHPKAQRIGLLATDGTVGAGLYQTQLTRRGRISVVPALESELQRQLMDAIYAEGWGVKSTGLRVSDRAQATVLSAIESLATLGAELVIIGCTELSAALHELPAERRPVLPWVDPLEVAADLVLDLSFGPGGN